LQAGPTGTFALVISCWLEGSGLGTFEPPSLASQMCLGSQGGRRPLHAPLIRRGCWRAVMATKLAEAVGPAQSAVCCSRDESGKPTERAARCILLCKWVPAYTRFHLIARQQGAVVSHVQQRYSQALKQVKKGHVLTHGSAGVWREARRARACGRARVPPRRAGMRCCWCTAAAANAVQQQARARARTAALLHRCPEGPRAGAGAALSTACMPDWAHQTERRGRGLFVLGRLRTELGGPASPTGWAGAWGPASQRPQVAFK
jgi:hypothetical protein